MTPTFEASRPKLFSCAEIRYKVKFNRKGGYKSEGASLSMRSHRPIRHRKDSARRALCIDLGILKSDSPVRNIEFNRFLTRINVCASYSLVIFRVGLQHDRQKTESATLGALVKRKDETIERFVVDENT
jgi:hypothetical protein